MQRDLLDSGCYLLCGHQFQLQNEKKMSYCRDCKNHLSYPLEQKENLCSAHLYLDGGYSGKMMITDEDYIIPKPDIYR